MHIMKTANFILSIFAALCSLGMIYGAIVTESPIKSVSVIIFSIISLLCVRLVVMTYRELKEYE
nr:MAG TPA: hypothetical protein [Caudoviricetes sp.]DAK56132.1 MAG TPA: hypothetical protein [Caudoviricetes sp.]DAV59477.1 MAG TPA: hypothetical protein [Caudoviricetes sp.]